MNAEYGGKILIVDDEVEQLRTLRLALRSRRYQAATARNVKEALQQLSEESAKFDIVLTDYAMPGMDGLEFLKRIRAEHGSLSVIMMTAYGRKEVLVEALRNQCNGFIEKPFTMEELIQEIERVRLGKLRETDPHELLDLIPQMLHQINNPLTCIVSNAELGMCHTDGLNEDQLHEVKKNLTDILGATQEIERINKELLKIRRGLSNAVEPVELASILTDCLRSFEGVFEVKDILVEQELDVCSACVHGNRFGLEQVFRNLVLNAIEAMEGVPERFLKVAISCVSNSMAQVVIEDTGCGMSQDLLHNAFTSYFTTKKRGTGLGLAVVKRIIHSHNGRIEVVTDEGRGTTFKIMLPLIATPDLHPNEGRDDKWM